MTERRRSTAKQFPESVSAN